MMDIFSTIIYGIIQGLTEFLPVSSSAHLALLPEFLHIKDPGVFFDLSMHVGTALAIILYYFSEVKMLTVDGFYLVTRSKKNLGRQRFLLNMVIATVVTIIVVLLIKRYALEYGRTHWLIALNLIFFGLLMAFSDRKKSQNELNLYKEIQIRKSMLIGLAQAMAIFPGVSRSGITITAARFAGMSREEASKFIFLLALPVILGGFVIELPNITRAESFSLYSSLVGLAVSFIVGMLAIHFFLKILSKMGLWVFTVYRVALGIFLLAYFH